MRKYLFNNLLLGLLGCAGVAAAVAGDKGNVDAERDRHLAFLEWEAGVWDADIALMNPADGQMQHFKGRQIDRLSGCGLWLITDLEMVPGPSGETPPPYQGHGVLGFDPAKQKLVGLWVDSKTDWLAVAEGTLDEESTTLRLEIESRHPVTGEPMSQHFVTRKVDVRTKKLEALIPGPDGALITVATIVYTRRQTE